MILRYEKHEIGLKLSKGMDGWMDGCLLMEGGREGGRWVAETYQEYG